MSQPMTGRRFETLHVLHTAANHRPDTYDAKMKYVCPVVWPCFALKLETLLLPTHISSRIYMIYGVGIILENQIKSKSLLSRKWNIIKTEQSEGPKGPRVARFLHKFSSTTWTTHRKLNWFFKSVSFLFSRQEAAIGQPKLLVTIMTIFLNISDHY